MPEPAPMNRESLAMLREKLASEVSAYPGTLTYHDLIRKNKRQSVMLIALMLVVFSLVGLAIGAAIAVYGGAEAPRQLLPSALIGLVAAIFAGGIASVWSWFGGANAILRMSGAYEIAKSDDPQLWNVVEEMAIAAGLPMPRVFIIRDNALNAFAAGRDPAHAAVAVTEGLRKRMPRDELQAVIAHEMAHVRHLDVRFAMLMATLVGLVVFAADAFLRIAFRGAVYGGGRSRKDGGGAAIIFVIVIAALLAIIAPLGARIIQMAYSRQREFLADAGAVQLTRDPGAMARALHRLTGDPQPLVEAANRGTAHMFIVNPLVKSAKDRMNRRSIFASHPCTHERIARMLALLR